MIKQNPFSFYDFLGYFIPGAIVLQLCLLIPHFDQLNSYADIINLLSKREEFQTDKFIFFIIISYSIGHLINYISSITIERFAYWKYDYPSKYLIGTNHHQKYFRKDILRKNYIYRIILAAMILPVFLWDKILGEYLKFKDFYTKKLDVFLINVITSKFLILLETLCPPTDIDIKDKDYHRILAHYVYENSKNHQSKLSNYVALYGFLRCLCLITVISFWIYVLYLFYDVISYFKHINKFDFLRFITDFSFTKMAVLICISVIAYIYFMAFMKFYRRYTLETYMLITIDREIVLNNDKVKKKPPIITRKND